jgi:hypothetical protein
MGKICAKGQCVTKACEPGTVLCASGNVQRCDPWGSSFYEWAACGVDGHCEPRPGGAVCVQNDCTPSAPGCVGEQFGQCSSDGVAVTGAVDCAASQQVCTEQGCAAQAVDTLNASKEVESSSSGGLLVNVLEVTVARKLTTIESYLVLPEGRTLRWVVYELVGNTYTLKLRTTTVDSGTGFHSSGPISFTLVPGKTYAIGVEVLANSFGYELGPITAQQKLPFARVKGSVNNSASTDTFPGNYGSTVRLFYARLTTAAP